MKKFKIWLWLPLVIIVFIAILAIDYFDLPSKLGLDVANMNMSLVGIVAGAFITLSLFIITYYLIDQWNVRKNKNKREIANHVLAETYKKCRHDIDMINQPFILQALVNKTDFNKAKDESNPASVYSKAPFVSESIIIDLSKDGIISADQLNCYLNVKTEYRTYCDLVVSFFDAPDIKMQLKQKVLDALEAAEKTLE